MKSTPFSYGTSHLTLIFSLLLSSFPKDDTPKVSYIETPVSKEISEDVCKETTCEVSKIEDATANNTLDETVSEIDPDEKFDYVEDIEIEQTQKQNDDVIKSNEETSVKSCVEEILCKEIEENMTLDETVSEIDPDDKFDYVEDIEIDQAQNKQNDEEIKSNDETSVKSCVEENLCEEVEENITLDETVSEIEPDDKFDYVEDIEIDDQRLSQKR